MYSNRRTISSFTYTYDPAGNGLTRTDKDGNVLNYSYDAANRIQSAGSITYEFDSNGNMAGKTTPEGTTAYNYDLENRLANVALPDGSINSFVYNGDGKRTRKETPSVAINYLYDGMSVIEETDQAGTLIASYTTDPTALIGQIISRKDSAGQVDYYSYDGIGSTRNLTDQSQAQIASYIYDSFGNLLSSTDTVQPYKFSTKEFDQTGLYYFGARYYDSETGRFITKDPIPGNLEDPQNLNSYVYCQNDPVNKSDPKGELSWTAVAAAAIIGGALGAAWEAGWYLYGHPYSWSWSGLAEKTLIGTVTGGAAGAALVGLSPLIGLPVTIIVAESMLMTSLRALKCRQLEIKKREEQLRRRERRRYWLPAPPQYETYFA